MENKKNNTAIVVIAACVILVLIGAGAFYFINKNKQETPVNKNTIVNKYTAYIKINPSIKLDYSQTCKKNEKGTFTCEEPIVDNYTLVNEDAESIYEDVDLFAKGKTLDKVIELICDKAEENNIETKNIEITSDWKEINTYVETATKDDKEERTYNVNISTKEEIEKTVKQEEKSESGQTEEETKTTTTTTTTSTTTTKTTKKTSTTSTTKKTTTTTTKTTASTVIDLSKGVKYSHSMITYSCDKCFSDSLINSLKNVKGTAFVSGNDSEITIKWITSLSDPYNTSTYKGTAPTSKIKAAGGEEIGGAGGSDDDLTAADCKEFHLSCK